MKKRQRMTSKAKRRNAPKAAHSRRSSVDGKDKKIAQLTRERDEALEQQAATAKVLQVISGSRGDLQPVFASVLENAVRICDSTFGNVYLWDGGGLHLVATHNTPPALAAHRRHSLYRPSPISPMGRAIEKKTVVHVVDATEERIYTEQREPGFVASVDLGGIRTYVAVPLLKENELIGLLTVFRQQVDPFSNKQIDLLTNFAAQAVIAIENARLLNELRESLDQQTATSEVLSVISSSRGELEPVFQAMLENATRICEAKFGTLYQYDGNEFHLSAVLGAPPTLTEFFRQRGAFKPPPGTPLNRLLRTKEVIRATDDSAAETPSPSAQLAGAKSHIAVPMFKGDELAGAIVIYRQEVRPFTDKQVELVKNFAAQAVIAIENARLLNEQRESLERQTAISEVLQIISSSRGEIGPVFQTILANATRICDAKFGLLHLYKGDAFSTVELHNVPRALADFVQQRGSFAAPSGSPLDRLLQASDVIYTADEAAEANPGVAARLGGARSLIAVPMNKDGKLIGAIVIYRQEVRPFSDKQIELVQNFAAQAVIAIENARLLNELRESLDQQTATSEVLSVISSSPGELEPVFGAILENATQICQARFGTLHLYDGEVFRRVALHNPPPEFAMRRGEVIRPHPKGGLGTVARTKQVAYIDDVRNSEPYLEGNQHVVEFADRSAARTAIAVPMLKDDELIGAIAIFRQEVRPFTDKQIELVKNFAAQAVIAIENARLLNDLNQLNQQLEQRVADQVSEIERMGKLRRFLPPQVADLIVASGTEKQLESHRREITALFCDLRGFTGFSESSDPEDVMALLREYHAAIGGIINKYGGTLERYAGDGVMVVFNDPIPIDNPALQAVLMAIDMRAAIEELIEKWHKLGHDIGFGIGIAHGFATLGTIGFEGRFDYAAIGTVSNVASRLCDEAKPGQILISPRVLMAVEKDITVESVGDFALKGIRRPMAAYNVLDSKVA